MPDTSENFDKVRPKGARGMNEQTLGLSNTKVNIRVLEINRINKL